MDVNLGHRGVTPRGRGAGAVLALDVLVLPLAATVASAGSDYIPSPPATVYEGPQMDPQNMDYDRENQMFLAHPGWLKDKLVHYYKFRMYTPMTYPSKVPTDGIPDIPVNSLFLLTTTGDFTGIVSGQKPILRWHTADGENYSDFVQVYWVTVNPGYAGDSYRSYADVVENVTSNKVVASDIFVNLPVVPTGSKLQDPIAGGTTAAPIQPLMVWYRGVEVQTFAFETTSQAFADHFNPVTRQGSASQAGSGFEIVVVPFMSGADVLIVPIWHLNQYPMGVVTGVNHGGPWTGGQRNIIDADRLDPGYSPLWQVLWATRVPVGYTADMASNANQLTESNGFELMATPMYVNCPNVGPHGGGGLNPDKASSFGKSTVAPGETLEIAGSYIMEAGKTVKAYVGEAEIASTQSLMMGAYLFEISADSLPEGLVTIDVRGEDGAVLQSVTVARTSVSPLVPAGLVLPLAVGVVAVVVAGIVAAIVMRKRKVGPR